jgi:hypothetical protein
MVQAIQPRCALAGKVQISHDCGVCWSPNFYRVVACSVRIMSVSRTCICKLSLSPFGDFECYKRSISSARVGDCAVRCPGQGGCAPQDVRARSMRHMCSTSPCRLLAAEMLGALGLLLVLRVLLLLLHLVPAVPAAQVSSPDLLCSDKPWCGTCGSLLMSREATVRHETACFRDLFRRGTTETR